MAMQISSEQSDWLKDFLSRGVGGMKPEMAINTAGGGAPGDSDGPGMMERMDAAVNAFGRSVSGTGSHKGEPEPAPQPVPVPEVPDMDRGQEKAADVPIYWPPRATPAAEEPGLLERMDASVNEFGRWISGSGGHKGEPESAPLPVAAPKVPNMDWGQEKAEDVPIYRPPPPPAPAPEQPGVMERMGNAVSSLFG